MMHHEKDDEIDTAAIGDLLRRGEGTPFRPSVASTWKCSNWIGFDTARSRCGLR